MAALHGIVPKANGFVLSLDDWQRFGREYRAEFDLCRILQADYIAASKALSYHAELPQAEARVMVHCFGSLVDGVKDAPRAAIADRKVATMSLPEAVSYVRGIFRNELDRMMAKFKKTQPDFYGAYFNSRIIIDRTGTHAAPKPQARPTT